MKNMANISKNKQETTDISLFTENSELEISKIRHERIQNLHELPTEENLWRAIVAFQHYPFKTVTGLPYEYTLKIGKKGNFNKELLIDRREKSKTLTWSSVLTAFKNSKKIAGEVERPKALGDIRGISYIYPIFFEFGLIKVPLEIETNFQHN